MASWDFNSKACAMCDQGPKAGAVIESTTVLWEGFAPTEPLTRTLQYAGMNPVEISTLAYTMGAIMDACNKVLETEFSGHKPISFIKTEYLRSVPLTPAPSPILDFLKSEIQSSKYLERVEVEKFLNNVDYDKCIKFYTPKIGSDLEVAFNIDGSMATHQESCCCGGVLEMKIKYIVCGRCHRRTKAVSSSQHLLKPEWNEPLSLDHLTPVFSNRGLNPKEIEDLVNLMKLVATSFDEIFAVEPIPQMA